MPLKDFAHLIMIIGYIFIFWSDWGIAAGVALIHLGLKIDEYES